VKSGLDLETLSMLEKKPIEKIPTLPYVIHIHTEHMYEEIYSGLAPKKKSNPLFTKH
jgi:hypothetical protein